MERSGVLKAFLTGRTTTKSLAPYAASIVETTTQIESTPGVGTTFTVMLPRHLRTA